MRAMRRVCAVVDRAGLAHGEPILHTVWFLQVLILHTVWFLSGTDLAHGVVPLSGTDLAHGVVPHVRCSRTTATRVRYACRNPRP
eukprot:316836-Rhodomonas_salina.1